MPPATVSRADLARRLAQTSPLGLSAAEWRAWRVDYQHDEGLALVAVQTHGYAGYRCLAMPFRRREDLFLAALRRTPQHVRDLVQCLLAPDILARREVALAVASADVSLLEHAKLAPFRSDRAFVLAVATTAQRRGHRGYLLGLVSPALCDDDEIVRAAVRSSPGNFRFASPRLRGDRALALAAIRKDGNLVVHVSSNDLCEDPAIGLAAVRENAFAYSYLSPTLSADPAIARAAVQTTGLVWPYIHPALQPELLGLALERNGNLIAHLPDALRGDRTAMLGAMAKHGRKLGLLPAALRADRAIVLAAVRSHGAALAYATDALKADPDVVAAAVAKHPPALRFSPLRHDAAFVRKLVETTGEALAYAAVDVRERLDCRMAAHHNAGDDAVVDDLLTEAEQHVAALLERAETLATHAVCLAGHRTPAHLARASALLADVMRPDGPLHRTVHKRSYTEAFF